MSTSKRHRKQKRPKGGGIVKKRHRERCAYSGKIKFSRSRAEETAATIMAVRQPKMRVYQCEACHFWHLTSKPLWVQE